MSGLTHPSHSARPAGRHRRRRDGARQGTRPRAREREVGFGLTPLDQLLGTGLTGAYPVLRSPAAPLTLPRIGPDVPLSVRFAQAGPATAEIAAALLAEGILRPMDWVGSLAGTVHHGLTRWVQQELRLSPQSTIAVQLVWTDELERVYHGQLGAQAWAAENEGDETKPVGAFGLIAGGYRETWVGEAIRELNRVQGNLGWHVLSVVTNALEDTIGAVTPSWITRDLEWQGVEHSDEEIEEFDIITLEKFQRLVPKQACSWVFKRASLDRALRKLAAWGGRGDGLPCFLTPEQRRLVELARELADLCPWGSRFSNDVPRFESEAEAVLPVAVRWKAGDKMERFADEYHDQLANSGYETDLVWAACFQVHDPETVHAAVRRLKRLIPVVALADRILGMLTREPEQFRVRVRV